MITTAESVALMRELGLGHELDNPRAGTPRVIETHVSVFGGMPGETVTRYAIGGMPYGWAYDTLGGVIAYKHRSSAERKLRQITRALVIRDGRAVWDINRVRCV